jgi:hypothetical protein
VDTAQSPPADGYHSALDHSGSARHSSRVLLLLGAVMYVLWHFLHTGIRPSSVDPLAERLAVSGFVVGLVALSFRIRLRRYLVAMGYAAVALATAHYFCLVARNQVATPYLVGVFVMLASFNLLIVSVRAIVVYAVFAFALAAAVALRTSSVDLEARLVLVGGVFTVEVALATAVWRNVALARAAREVGHLRREVKQLRGLLPICMHCNRIRAQDDTWQRVEDYVESHTEASFTHSLCKQCLETHYPS